MAGSQPDEAVDLLAFLDGLDSEGDNDSTSTSDEESCDDVDDDDLWGEDTEARGNPNDSEPALPIVLNYTEVQPPEQDISDHDVPGSSTAATTSPLPKRRRGRPKGTGSSLRSRSLPVDIWAEARGEDVATSSEFRFQAERTCGMRASLSKSSTPLDCFLTLFDEQVFRGLVTTVNNYAKIQLKKNNPLQRCSRLAEWREVTVGDMKRYVAVLIAIGLGRRSSLADYWSRSPSNKTPWYHKQFSRNRFQLLHSTMMHCAGGICTSKQKIEPFAKTLLKNFQNAFYPHQNVSIDEMVIGWKGRFKHKTYNASKPKKYHIKTFGLCDSKTGYVVNLLIYFGLSTSYEMQGNIGGETAVKVFDTLLKPLSSGHHIFADRYYTTKKLIEYLLEKHFYYTGTVHLNRKGFPNQLKSLQLNHQESKFFVNGDEKVIVVAWRDKKAKTSCFGVSTKSDTSVSGVTNRHGSDMLKPALINSYNNNMNGCDRADQAISYYGQYQRKTTKWWKKVFHWLLEISQFNAHILYQACQKNKKVRLRDFKYRLIEQLCQQSGDVNLAKKYGEESEDSEESDGHVTTQQHIVKYSTRRRRCKFCSTPEKPKKAHFFCTGCVDVYLHPRDCFILYHESLGLKK